MKLSANMSLVPLVNQSTVSCYSVSYVMTLLNIAISIDCWSTITFFLRRPSFYCLSVDVFNN
ncbi:hypothetical protein V6N12_030767 [Hibiscus sabdariffa]|uniref:Uncharacterized protein n=1 Tax=Hibiscus sabdariffa TaxID=183260 RepID=A0ABR2E708_9ROSI